MVRKSLRQPGLTLRKQVSATGAAGTRYWDSLKWKPVDVASENLGDFADSVFLGLEELDASCYLPKKAENREDDEADSNSQQPAPGKKNKKRKKTQAVSVDTSEEVEVTSSGGEAQESSERKKKAKKASNQDCKEWIGQTLSDKASWGSMTLPQCFVTALQQMDFASPTPIQVLAQQSIGKGGDVVGVAETGSGKTLAFALPVLESVLSHWNHHPTCPHAIVLTPTRELALQIATVMKDVSQRLLAVASASRPSPDISLPVIRVVSVIGGFSDLKQRRLLQGPVHVLVATPGRLVDLLNDGTLPALMDLSALRYLVIDEADRMMEEGHFGELQEIVRSIQDHESIVSKGEEVSTVLARRQRGEDIVEEDSEREEEQEDELEQKKKKVSSSHDAKHPRRGHPAEASSSGRQSLLFSATALQSLSLVSSAKQAKCRLAGTVRGVRSGYALSPTTKQLLSLVGCQRSIEVVEASPAAASTSSRPETEGEEGEEDDSSPLLDMSMTLPSTLSHYQLQCTQEDKESILFFYLHRHMGRSLVFVNSIQTAKRLANVLTALQSTVHVLHADMIQKQRVATLEKYSRQVNAVLIATDVAARGLDLKQINHVIHYDIARSPQLYVHRSGRTARAGAKGSAVSIVTPEDNAAHQAICKALLTQTKAFPKLPVDYTILPRIRERVFLAKKIFSASHKLSQHSKETNWIKLQAKETGLDLDEELLYETGHDANFQEQQAKQKKQVQQWRQQLKDMLQQPLEVEPQQQQQQQQAFRGGKQGDWRKRAAFFVYAK